MAYNYYQSHVPGWGTQQFQFGPPPAPGFQPSDTWSGLDYYRAHANRYYDPGLYQNAVSRAGAGAMGVGLHEAEHWHRRAYGGLGEVTRMLPAEIGYAAAYEAYRQFTYNLSSYSHLFSSFERRRDALTGLAVAEATRLWQDTGRGHDQYGLQSASEAAAATASLLLGQAADREGMALGGDNSGYHRSRRNSANYPLGSSYGMDDPYRGRPMGRASPIPGYGESAMYAPQTAGVGYGGASPNMRVPSPNPMAPYPMGGSPMPMSSSPYAGGSPMPMSSSPYAGTMPMSSSPYAGGNTMPMSSSPYAGGNTMPISSSPYAGSVASSIGRSPSPMPAYYTGQQAYGAGQYPATAGYPGSYTMPQQQAPTVIIASDDRGSYGHSSRRHGHRHGHGHHRRHHSADRYGFRY